MRSRVARSFGELLREHRVDAAQVGEGGPSKGVAALARERNDHEAPIGLGRSTLDPLTPHEAVDDPGARASGDEDGGGKVAHAHRRRSRVELVQPR